jgi:quercetin dioxygenase-like cupin family protein
MMEEDTMRGQKFFGRLIVGTGAVLTIGAGIALATSGNTQSSLVGPLALYEPFKLERRDPSQWAIKIEAKDGVQLATQTITFESGHYSGWHSHPGPVFISVKTGTMSFYDRNCNRTVLDAGHGFLDVGDDPHFAVNETDSTATNVVTYFVPPGQQTFRIDQPAPATCPLP